MADIMYVLVYLSLPPSMFLRLSRVALENTNLFVSSSFSLCPPLVRSAFFYAFGSFQDLSFLSRARALSLSLKRSLSCSRHSRRACTLPLFCHHSLSFAYLSKSRSRWRGREREKKRERKRDSLSQTRTLSLPSLDFTHLCPALRARSLSPSLSLSLSLYPARALSSHSL